MIRILSCLLFVFSFLAFGAFHSHAGNEKWYESRQFEQHIEKTTPDVMKFIWATHISEEGLEVQLAAGIYSRTFVDEQGFYKTISELWKNSALVKEGKYSGKVKFMQLDRTVKTIE